MTAPEAATYTEMTGPAGGLREREAEVRRRLVIAAVVLLPFALGIAVTATSQGGPSYAADVEPLFAKRCGDCHSVGEAKENLVLDRGRGYAQMVRRPSVQDPRMQLVTPGDPDRSYLWLKLDHTATEGKGMPRTMFGAKKLPDGELELVRRWIATGAAP